MLNLTLAGYVGNDAKKLENGGCVFNIAHTEKGYTNKDNVDVPEKTTWVSVFYRSDKIADYIKKGSYIIAIANNINTAIYDGKVQLSCNATAVEFGGKSDKTPF